jgi:hypothetical protein
VPVLRFLLAQAAGWLLVFGLLRLGLPLRGPTLAVAQAVAAALAARLLRSERWWLIAHAGFTPLVWLASQWAIAPHWYLAGFVLLAVFYWTSFRTRVPLFLSNRATVDALEPLLPASGFQMLDAGAGTGSALRPLARRHPHGVFVGIEAAPGPWLIGALLARGLPNLVWRRGDFWSHDWSRYDLVYVFLSPVPMPAVWDKARREMRAGSLLVSNSFPVPGLEPARVIDPEGGGRTLYVYAPGGETPE